MTGIYDCPYWVFIERYSHEIFGVLSKTKSEFPYMVEWNYLEPYRVLTMTWNWGISPRSSLNHFYSPSFSFMHNVPTVFRIIMNPASFVSSMSFYRLTFELKLVRHDSPNVRALGDAEVQWQGWNCARGLLWIPSLPEHIDKRYCRCWQPLNT